MSVETVPTGGHGSYVHEALLYEDDDEFTDVAAPFVLDGVAAGEPTFLAVTARERQLILDQVGPDSGAILLDSAHYTTPFDAVRNTRRLVSDVIAAGAPRVRMIGAVPATRATWPGWARYEAAITHVLQETPAWGLCSYDLRTTAREVVDDVLATHTHVARGGGDHVGNPSFVDPQLFVEQLAERDVDALELDPPTVDLTGPTAAEARDVVNEISWRSELLRETVAGLELAVGEVVTNALVHGRTPIRLRAWTAADRLIVAVDDAGPGIDDPFIAFADGMKGGHGLYIAHLVADVTYHRRADGFTVRLVARRPALAPEEVGVRDPVATDARLLVHARRLDAVRREIGLTAKELHLSFIALTGRGTLDDLNRHLAGSVLLAPREHDKVVVALNERLAEIADPRRLPYVDEPS